MNTKHLSNIISLGLSVYNFLCFTSILFFYAFDYTGLGFAGLGWCPSRSHTPWSRSRSRSHCSLSYSLVNILVKLFHVKMILLSTPLQRVNYLSE